MTSQFTADYVYGDPTLKTDNYGDHVINLATLAILKRHIGLPSIKFNPRVGHIPAGDYRCAIIPGVTLLSHSTEQMTFINGLLCPCFCLAGAIWQQRPVSGLLLRSKILFAPGPPRRDIGFARRLSAPVGTRDRFTYELLRREGIECLYTGCPTLWLTADNIVDGGYVLFSCGRGAFRQQTRAAARLARKHHVVGICHEVNDRERLLAAGWRLPLVSLDDDIELYLSYFQQASVVVTGRLHGALPALAYGKRLFYFGDRDTRTTILDDLGVPIHDYRELPRAVEMASAAYNKEVLEFFRRNWLHLLSIIRSVLGMPASATDATQDGRL